jgi:hypothetical protein
VARYEELYARGAYVGSAERERIQALLRPSGRKRDGWARALRRTGPYELKDPVTMPEPREPDQGKLF